MNGKLFCKCISKGVKRVKQLYGVMYEGKKKPKQYAAGVGGGGGGGGEVETL